MLHRSVFILEFLIIFSTVLQVIKANGLKTTAEKRMFDAGVSVTYNCPSHAVLREIHNRSFQPLNLNDKLILLIKKQSSVCKKYISFRLTVERDVRNHSL